MAKKQRPTVNDAFMRAARDGDFEGVRHYFEEGASLNARDAQGRSAMHIAAERGFSKTIDILVELGADINATDSQKETPLHRAARQQTHGADTSAQLILNGADVTLKNRFGETAFTLVKQENRTKQVLRGAWLAALKKNPLDLSVVTDHDIVVSKALNIKRRTPPTHPSAP